MTQPRLYDGDEALAELLDDFEAQCPIPTPEDLAAWQAHHPEHARALLRRAGAMARQVIGLIDEIEGDLAAERAAGREPPADPWDRRRGLH